MSLLAYKNYLAHHGIKGQKWGIRRFQNEDGSLTPEGRERYGQMGNEVYKGGIFSNKSKKIEALDLTEEKKMFREIDKQLDDLNDKVWEAASKDLDSNKLNNKALNKYLDEHIKQKGNEYPNFFDYGDDEKILNEVLPNMSKALKDYSEVDSKKQRELANLTNNLIKNLDRYKYGSKEFKNEINTAVINKLARDVDMSAKTSSQYVDANKNYKSHMAGYLDALQEGYDIEDYIENYGRKKGIEFKY